MLSRSGSLAGVEDDSQTVSDTGRGVFAKQSFKKGDVIFKEKPLVCSQFLWNEFYKYLACEHCMKSLETSQAMASRLSANPLLVLPHPECCEVNKEQQVVCPACQTLYCSKECRDEAFQQYHQILCMGQSPADPEHPLARLQEMWRNIHFPPETASIMLIAKMIATCKQAQDKDAVISSFSSFRRAAINEEQELAHKLLGKQFKDQIDNLLPLLIEALYEESLSQWFTADGIRSLLALIGTNSQGVGTSSLSVYVHNCDALELGEDERHELDSFIDQLYLDLEQESDTFLNCEGSALYTLQSCCNHSCTPNAEVTFPENNAILSMVATEDIQEGEEICTCYLDECSRGRSRHSRQKYLRENYLFNCLCPKCQSQCDDPDMTSDDEDDDELEDMEDDQSDR
ncbi:protein-lysine N-trimethyltransferase SMYD5-like isoform X2 [Ptychodera flava]|uniref:protein-lysine N-trimethyltransferase SMYD5-like isoform X2 n=1 Tax=Ptychodera flava TaxID=63121 RepID=UPI00396A47AB